MKKIQKKKKFNWYYNDELMEFIKKLLKDTGGKYNKSSLINELMSEKSITIIDADYIESNSHAEQMKKGSSVKAFNKNAGQIQLHYYALKESSNIVKIDKTNTTLFNESLFVRRNIFHNQLKDKKCGYIGNEFGDGDCVSVVLKSIQDCLRIYDLYIQGEVSIEPLNNSEKNNYLRELELIIKDSKFEKRTSSTIDLTLFNEAQHNSSASKKDKIHNEKQIISYDKIIAMFDDIDNDIFKDLSEKESTEISTTLEQIKDSYIDGSFNEKDIFIKKKPIKKNGTDLIIWLLKNAKLVKQCAVEVKHKDDHTMEEILIKINEIAKQCNAVCLDESKTQMEHIDARKNLIRVSIVGFIKMVDYLKSIDEQFVN